MECGLKEKDWAAGYYQFVQSTTLPGKKEKLQRSQPRFDIGQCSGQCGTTVRA